ncbi:MAG TPA: VIT and VWA domain-containing protein [Planctomycetota bacterium]|nr:VIT and VWA domain-containing protein [Planctomycetota bacterium]
MNTKRIILFGVLMLSAVQCLLYAGEPATSSFVPRASNLIIPQSRSFAVAGGAAAASRAQPQITGVTVGVVIVDQAATTTMDVAIANRTGRAQEAEMLVPVPDAAALRGFSFEGAAAEPTAELLPKEKAKGMYESIVAKVRDPALVEFAGYNLIRTSVFPVPANGTQKVRITYDHLLQADGNRVDYFLPRSESLTVNVPWEISVKIKSKQAITAVYSPSHNVVTANQSRREVAVRLAAGASTEPGPFILSYLVESGSVTASLMAYPDAKIGGGYFLLLAAVPPAEAAGNGAGRAVGREVTLVIDRSGSMAGQKMEQVRAAALQVIDGLFDGEYFNVIDYSGSVASFAPAPVVRNEKNIDDARHYIRGLAPGGGTNIHDAIAEALRQKPAHGLLPVVLFLTDGLPTVGVRDEVAIREAAVKGNAHSRRIFTFGVGYDVNAPLLNHLATNSRAVSTFVLPQENVEDKISQVYRRLTGPVLASPKIESLDSNGAVSTRRVAEVQPGMLPDLFEGDKLVLLGRYSGDEPLRFRLSGEYRGTARAFEFTFHLNSASVRNSFVPRLWASRKVGFLVDQIRQAGANVKLPATAAPSVTDPRMKELIDEIVRLSTEFGILTEYTAFLATEGTDLAQPDEVIRQATSNLANRAYRDRSGIGAVNQDMNGNFQRSQVYDNRRNGYFDRNMNRVQVTTVQQVSDRAFFQRGNRWIDSRAAHSAADGKAADAAFARTIAFGSPEYFRLVDQLVNENRQSVLSMSGEILLNLDGENVLVK